MGGFQRWQINSFDQKPAITTSPVISPAIEEVHINKEPVVMTEEPVSNISLPSAEEIERIKRVCSYLGCVEVEKSVLRNGEEVEILSGHFAGVRGQIISCGVKCKFRISIPALGTYITVEIDDENVRRAS